MSNQLRDRHEIRSTNNTSFTYTFPENEQRVYTAVCIMMVDVLMYSFSCVSPGNSLRCCLSSSSSPSFDQNGMGHSSGHFPCLCHSSSSVYGICPTGGWGDGRGLMGVYHSVRCYYCCVTCTTAACVHVAFGRTHGIIIR